MLSPQRRAYFALRKKRAPRVGFVKNRHSFREPNGPKRAPKGNQKVPKEFPRGPKGAQRGLRRLPRDPPLVTLIMSPTSPTFSAYFFLWGLCGSWCMFFTRWRTMLQGQLMHLVFNHGNLGQNMHHVLFDDLYLFKDMMMFHVTNVTMYPVHLYTCKNHSCNFFVYLNPFHTV